MAILSSEPDLLVKKLDKTWVLTAHVMSQKTKNLKMIRFNLSEVHSTQYVFMQLGVFWLVEKSKLQSVTERMDRELSAL